MIASVSEMRGVSCVCGRVAAVRCEIKSLQIYVSSSHECRASQDVELHLDAD